MKRPKMILTLLIGIPAPPPPKPTSLMKKSARFNIPDDSWHEVRTGADLLQAKSTISKRSTKSRRFTEKSVKLGESTIWRIQMPSVHDPMIHWPITDQKHVFNVFYSAFKGEKINLQIVICGSYARIMYKARVKAVKIIQIQGTCWVPFTMLHQPSTELSPQAILRHDIEIDVKPSTEMSKEPEFYYEFQYADGKGRFPQMVRMLNYDTIPAKPERELSWEECSPMKMAGQTLVIHRAQVERIMDRSSHAILQSRSMKSITKKSKRESYTSGRKSAGTANVALSNEDKEYPKLTIKGEEILYEKPVWIAEKANPRPEIHHIAACVTISETMSVQNILQLRPFSIYIRSLYKLPHRAMSQLRIKQIMVKYSYPPVCDTIQVGPFDVISFDKVKINSLKTYFCPSDTSDEKPIPDTLIIEALQQRNLIIKIYGLRQEHINKERGCVFGENLNDDAFSERVHKKVNTDLYDKMMAESRNSFVQKKALASEIMGGNEIVPLCFASIPLDDLIEYSTTKMQKTVSLQSSIENTTHERYKRALKPILLAKIHESTKLIEYGALSERELIEAGTMLKIEIKTGCSYKKNFLSKCLLKLPAYSRFFMIYKDTTLAYKQLKKLFEYNAKASVPNSNGLPNTIFHNLTLDEALGTKKFLLEKLAVRDSLRMSSGSNRTIADKANTMETNQFYVTGFLVDCITCCILLIEAPVANTVPIIMTDNFELGTSSGRLIYNSDLIFSERLYNEFLMFGGLYLCALGMPLESIMQSNWLMMKNFIPEPAVKCVESLEKIMRTKKISDDLFPTPQELMSCDFEFGVPMRKTSGKISFTNNTLQNQTSSQSDKIVGK